MAKKIIEVKIQAKKVDYLKVKTSLLAVCLFDDLKLTPLAAVLDKALDGWITKILKSGDFKAKKKTTYVLYGDHKIGAERILLVGLGDKKKATVASVREAAAVAAAKTVGLHLSDMVIDFSSGGGAKLSAQKTGQALSEGIFEGSYKYDELQTQTDECRPDKLVVTIANGEAKAVRAGAIIGQSRVLAATLANRPPNLMFPQALAAEASQVARKTVGLTCKILDEKQIKAKKMGGILAVGQGSDKKPRLIELKYTPSKKVKKSTPVVGLIGKAITFDAGGISIKPGQGMQDMKMDMSGGAAVLGAMKAIAELKLPVKVHGIICSAENMPGGGSYRPGDIITTYSGKTVEIHNTDAEGRMVLCDGIHYAKELNCDVIIDVATLTGACIVALGQCRAGLMGNHNGLIKQLQKASDISGESVWHLPCGDEFTEQMKSEIADLKNLGTVSRSGGACAAASFLREFAGEDLQWAHLDIAGPGMYDPAMKSKSGARGFGVRLLTEYVRSIS